MEKTESMIKQGFECEFCKRSFIKELSLINHSCEKKRRWFCKEDPHVRFAFMAWRRFYELSLAAKSANSKLTHREFIENKYYSSFVKFGKHIVDLNALEPAKFIDYVIKGNLPIDKWTHDFVYEQYVRELTRKELPEDALERNIMLMNSWSMESGEPWVDFFRKVSTGQAVAWLKSGRISPWLLYNADSSIELFDRCSPEQLALIKSYAPVGPWKVRFTKQRESCDFIRETLRKNGI